MKYKILFIIIILSISIYAIQVPLPTEFPSSFPSARIFAMGSSGTAIVDPSSSFYNPAMCALLSIPYFHLSFAIENRSSFAELIEKEPSISGKHISFFSFNSFQGGFAFHPLYATSYSNRYFEDDNLTRDLDVYLNEYILTFTTYTGSNEQYPVPFVLGINLKYLRGNFAETKIFYDSNNSPDSVFADISTGNGYGVDLGLLIVSGNFLIALSAKDIFTHIYWQGDIKDNDTIDYDKQIIPFSSSLGFTYVPNNNLILTINIDKIIENDMPFIYKGGLEYKFTRDYNDKDFLSSISTGSPAIRGGFSLKEFYGFEIVNFSCGLGYNMNNLTIDMGIDGKLENYMKGGLAYQLSLSIPFNL